MFRSLVVDGLVSLALIIQVRIRKDGDDNVDGLCLGQMASSSFSWSHDGPSVHHFDHDETYVSLSLSLSFLVGTMT